MNIRTILVVVAVFCFQGIMKSQDPFHYTYFDMTKVAMNPAFAGSFEGTARVGLLYREQDYGFAFGQFRNPTFYIDVPVIRGFRQQDWIGVGMSYIYDEQLYEEGKVVTIKGFGGISYHLAFDKKAKNVLSIGLASGTSSSYVTDPTITTYSELGTDPNPDPIENSIKVKNPAGGSSGGGGGLGSAQLTAGLHFRSYIGKETELNTGVSVANLTTFRGGRVDESIATGSYSTAPMRFLVYGYYKTPVADKIKIEPRLFFQYRQPSWDLQVQTLAYFLLNEEKGITLSGGLGYSAVNGLQFLLGADIKDFKIGYSFDLNLSDKTQVSGAAGAFELGVAYILKLYKKPKPDPVLVCPRF